MNKENLKNLIEQGQKTVFTKVLHVSKSGMTRRIALYVATGPGEIRNITHMAASVSGLRVHKDGGIVVHGAGMDMGFHLVYTLSRRLYGDGYALRHQWL